MFFLFIFYPLVAPVALLINCYYTINKMEKMDTRLNKYINPAPTIEGGVEAPIQTRMFHPWPDATPLTIESRYILTLQFYLIVDC